METSSISQFHDLMLVYAAYLIGAASPGPSNLAIMGVAMHLGRRQALTLAAGVVTGAMIWAMLAATGLSIVLASYAQILTIIKIAGGLYLFYLAWKSARSAVISNLQPYSIEGKLTPGSLFMRGVMLHLTNPKAVLVWLAIMSLGLKGEGDAALLLAILVGCAVLGTLVFGGYAMVFSTAPMLRLYQKARRWIEATLAMFFAYAGLRLLASRT